MIMIHTYFYINVTCILQIILRVSVYQIRFSWILLKKPKGERSLRMEKFETNASLYKILGRGRRQVKMHMDLLRIGDSIGVEGTYFPLRAPRFAHFPAWDDKILGRSIQDQWADKSATFCRQLKNSIQLYIPFQIQLISQ